MNIEIEDDDKKTWRTPFSSLELLVGRAMKNGQFNRPSSICFNKKNDLNIIEYFNHQLQICDSKLNFLPIIGR